MVISYVGAGGKTTTIHQMADMLVNNGATVAITTTTHMYKEENTVLGSREDVIERIKKRGWCIFGAEDKEDKRKIVFPGYDFCEFIKEKADYLLVEADGSRHKPAKFPRAYEPVIYKGSDRIILVTSIKALGHKVKDVVHGYKEACRQFGISEDTKVDARLLCRIIDEGYIKRLQVEPEIVITEL